MSGGLVAQGSGVVIANLALRHFMTGKLNHQHLVGVEAQNAGQPFGAYFETVQSYTAGSVVFSAMALEALINKLFIAPGDLRSRYGASFDATFWGTPSKKGKMVGGIERDPPLDKYEEAITKMGAATMTSTPEYAAADAVLQLRHAFVHFKPDWGQASTSLQQLLSSRFALNPRFGAGDDFLTMQCMGSACSAWALDAVRGFVRLFGQRTHLDPKKLSGFV